MGPTSQVLAEASRQARLDAKAVREKQQKAGGPIAFEIDVGAGGSPPSAARPPQMSEAKRVAPVVRKKWNSDESPEEPGRGNKAVEARNSAVVDPGEGSGAVQGNKDMERIQAMLPKQRRGWGPPTNAEELKLPLSKQGVGKRAVVAANPDRAPANEITPRDSKEGDAAEQGRGRGGWPEPVAGTDEDVEGAREVMKVLHDRDVQQQAHRAQAKQVRSTLSILML